MLNKKTIKLVGLFSLLALLTACGGGKVSVNADIPKPLVNTLPLNTHLYFTDTFANYQYQEKDKARSLSRLSFGDAQVILFERIFTQLVVLTPKADSPSLDLVIEPEILDLQYTSPKETKLNLYEVWLRYRVKITDPEDNIVADWVVKGYGKTPTATLKTANLAFNAATNIALRDVGAQLAIGFPKQPAVKALLKTKQLNAQRPQENDVFARLVDNKL